MIERILISPHYVERSADAQWPGSGHGGYPGRMRKATGEHGADHSASLPWDRGVAEQTTKSAIDIFGYPIIQ